MEFEIRSSRNATVLVASFEADYITHDFPRFKFWMRGKHWWNHDRCVGSVDSRDYVIIPAVRQNKTAADFAKELGVSL